MLFRKMLRTMLQYKAQFLSMIVMIALGIGVFVGFNMEWYSLERNTQKIYAATGFADYRIAGEQGFSEEDEQKIAGITGVDNTARVLSVNTGVKGESDTVALTVTSDPAVSGFLLITGEDYDSSSQNGVWLSDQYAGKNGLAVGDPLILTYKDIEIEGEIKGLIKSGEYLICLPDETQLMPDYTSHGFAYISPAMLKKALGTEFYSQINVISGLEKSDFIPAVNQALGKTYPILSKDETISWAEAQGEVEEGKTMGSVLPVLFLAIAILTMSTTMHRLTASEKTQIGTLKSLGFRNRTITCHYVGYALIIGLTGTVLGVGVGYLLGWYIMNPNGAMGTYIDMQDWTLYTPAFCWALLLFINLFMLLIGFLSVRSMLGGTAADTLRPYVPKRMKRLAIEKFRFWDKMRFGAQWNLRDGARHKSRTLMTLFGIVGCMILLVGSLGMQDTMDAFVDLFYQESIRYETRIHLDAETVTNARAADLAKEYEGDWSASTSVQTNGEAASLDLYHIEHDRVRFLNQKNDFTTLSDNGVYLCERIADEQGVGAGDTLTFTEYGTDQSYTVRIAGIIRSMTKSIILCDAYADEIGFPYRIDSIYTARSDVTASEEITAVQTKQSIMDSFDTFLELMNVMVALLILAAVILGIVVLYNLGVMSYTERYREMATLKVVGFRDQQIGRILIGQNLWLTVIGVLIGLPVGVGVLQYLIDALASEYEMSLVIGAKTYIFSIALTFGVSLLVGLMISRKNKKINMVEALKGTE